MIPVRLQLKNFMSYGEGVPPLDFAGLRLACLSGDNGNGKSALLDAMTWALFNQTRASIEDDLIRLGANDAQVYFDFSVDETLYRVHRGRDRKRGSVWEFQIWEEGGSLRTLSGVNARETKERIEALLRMDYKTFLATGYLAQGRADEFARATVTERKKVLADILDLSRYERLEDLAKERYKEALDRETDADRELAAIARQLEDEDYYVVRLEDAQRRRLAAFEEADALRAELDRLSQEVQAREQFQTRADDLRERMTEKHLENDADTRLLEETRFRIAQAETITARADEIQDAYLRFQTLTEKLRELQDDTAQFARLEGEARRLENAIRGEQEQLGHQHYSLQCEIEALEKEARDLVTFEQELQRRELEIAAFGDLDARANAIEKRRQAADDDFFTLREQHAEEKAQADALEKRLAALRSSDAAACEYCGQSLPLPRRQAAIDETDAELSARKKIISKVSASARTAKTAQEAARKEQDELRRDQATVAQLEARRAQASQEQLRLERRAKELPARRQAWAKLDDQLKAKDFARPAQERLVQISAEQERLERAVQSLEDTQKELSRYRDAERRHLELGQAEAVLSVEPARAREVEARLASRMEKMTKAQEQMNRLLEKIKDLPQFRAERDGVALQLKGVQNVLSQTEREIGDCEARLSRFAQLKTERTRWQTVRTEAALEKDNYKELQAAFGKKGVQALIIENALPEIQEAANELLQKMTAGAMSVQLLSQKERKTKTRSAAEAIETLDIILSDEMGQRPYEMYSGGEAFRVNFALRVALSKMLARRAGAPLQTLILDEGFGTQDPRGREAIVDALNSLGDDFALILCITHIEELKEAFPNRIEVVKGPNGSTFSVA